jgi:uncharacterized protein (DUF39 family)
VGIPIPILNEDILKATTVRDRDILGPLIDYSEDYPQATGRVITHFNFEELKSGQVEWQGKKIQTASLSSYARAREIAEILKAEIRDGDFILAEKNADLPREQSNSPMSIKEKP